LAGTTLTSIDLVANSTPAGRWYLQTPDLVCGVGKFAGGSRDHVLLKKVVRAD
jgi:hypothetical protein